MLFINVWKFETFHVFCEWMWELANNSSEVLNPKNLQYFQATYWKGFVNEDTANINSEPELWGVLFVCLFFQHILFFWICFLVTFHSWNKKVMNIKNCWSEKKSVMYSRHSPVCRISAYKIKVHLLLKHREVICFSYSKRFKNIFSCWCRLASWRCHGRASVSEMQRYSWAERCLWKVLWYCNGIWNCLLFFTPLPPPPV